MECEIAKPLILKESQVGIRLRFTKPKGHLGAPFHFSPRGSQTPKSLIYNESQLGIGSVRPVGPSLEQFLDAALHFRCIGRIAESNDDLPLAASKLGEGRLTLTNNTLHGLG